jgi:putative membrane protein
MKARAFNTQVFLELLCYCMFAGLLLYLVRSEKYLNYVTPRMAPFLYFAAAVMMIWALFGLGRLFRPQYKVRAAHCFVLAIPIILLLLPHNPVNAADLVGGYDSGNSSVISGTQTFPAEQPVGDDINQPGSGSSQPAASAILPQDGQSDAACVSDGQFVSPIDESILPGLDEKNNKITISNDNYAMWLSEIFMNMERYEGYTVSMTGFVFKDPEALKPDEFVPARMMMSCCVADLQIVGMLCKYDKAADLEAESWVTVEGTLFIGVYEYDGQKYDEPQLNVTKITPAEAVDGYVYPY